MLEINSCIYNLNFELTEKAHRSKNSSLRGHRKEILQFERNCFGSYLSPLSRDWNLGPWQWELGSPKSTDCQGVLRNCYSSISLKEESFLPSLCSKRYSFFENLSSLLFFIVLPALEISWLLLLIWASSA